MPTEISTCHNCKSNNLTEVNFLEKKISTGEFPKDRAEKINQKIKNVKKKIMRKMKRFLAPILSLKPKTPEVLNIELTNHCPMKCTICPRTYSMDREKGFMDIDLFKKIIDELASYRKKQKNTIFVHHFGESLLHPSFDEALEYGRLKGFPMGISCNPFVLSEEKALRLFKAKPEIVYLMMDGDCNETFYKIRGVKDAYDTSVLNAIKAFEIQKQYSPHTTLKIVIVDNPSFKDATANSIRFWKEEHGIDVYKKTFWNWNGEINEINEMASITQSESVCQQPFESACINWDGTVVPCCADYNKIEVIGDINQKSLLKIWNDIPIKNLREQLNSGIIKSKLCAKCSFTKHIKKTNETFVRGENTIINADITNSFKKNSIIFGKNCLINGKILNYKTGGNIKIGDYCYVGVNSNIFCADKIEIGDNVLIAHNVDIFDHDTHPLDPLERHEHFKAILKGEDNKKVNWNEKPIKICANAWICAKSSILKGVTIGEAAIVATGSIVTKDVEPYTIVAGNPAKKIKDICKPE